ncbi:MAG: hypothetical protein PHC88_04725 [Terrimicrobiaceae bacterium]|nr:hypothetical protein [Terrimicrobiaceae bacterium]
MKTNNPLTGSFKLIASVAFCFTLAHVAQSAVPTILKVSDAVAAGKPFNINGDGLNPGSSLRVAIWPSNGTSPSTPPAGYTSLPIIQTDPQGHFLVATLPAGTNPAVFNLWVQNADGWSSCYKMNGARPLFISDYQAHAGNSIEVVGRNFDRGEWGGSTKTYVRLNNGSGGTYGQNIVSMNPYAVTFTVGSAPAGTYYVEVSCNATTDWSRTTSGQTLTITNTGSGLDPLGLGVPWAQDFNWNNNYAVHPSGGDDTTAIQTVLNTAENNGGGVVNLDSGNYNISSALQMGANVVLKGQGRNVTYITYTGTGGGCMITTKGTGCLGGTPQLQGIANLSLQLSNPNTVSVRPDCMIALGDNFGVGMDSRVGNRIFISSVGMNYPVGTGDASGAHGRRAIGLLLKARERVLLQNNNWVGFGAGPSNEPIKQYCTYKNNYFEYAAGYTHTLADYSFIENNTIVVHGEYNQDSHGIFTRDNAYVANNSITGAGDKSNVLSDGEIICCEDVAGAFDCGGVISSTPTSMVVSPLVPLSGAVLTAATSNLSYGSLSVMITDGAGRGQLRKVAISGNTLSIVSPDPAFTTIPDYTSKWTLILPLNNWTVYKNTGNNCAAGIEPYGNAYDDVIADNTITDCMGIYTYAINGGLSSGGFFQAGTMPDVPSYFVRITRNNIQGVSARGNWAGISITTGRWNSPYNYFDVMAYGTEITGNTIIGDPAKTTFTMQNGQYIACIPADGILVDGYLYSSMSNGTGVGDVTNTLIAGNTIWNMPTAVTMTKCITGQMLYSNTTSSVTRFLADGGSVNTVQSGNTPSGSTTTYESENGLLGNTGGGGNMYISSDSAASGGRALAGFQPGAYNKITNVNGGAGGQCYLTIQYANGVPVGNVSTKSIYVNGSKLQQFTFPITGGWFGLGHYGNITVPITLNPGTGNTIAVQYDATDNNGGVNLDCYTINTP